MNVRFASYIYNYAGGIFSIYWVENGGETVIFQTLLVAVYWDVEVVNGNGHVHVPVALPPGERQILPYRLDRRLISHPSQCRRHGGDVSHFKKSNSGCPVSSRSSGGLAVHTAAFLE